MLRRCTPLGRIDLPPLPTEELAALKETLVNVFPLYRRIIAGIERNLKRFGVTAL